MDFFKWVHVFESWPTNRKPNIANHSAEQPQRCWTFTKHKHFYWVAFESNWATCSMKYTKRPKVSLIKWHLMMLPQARYFINYVNTHSKWRAPSFRHCSNRYISGVTWNCALYVEDTVLNGVSLTQMQFLCMNSTLWACLLYFCSGAWFLAVVWH